MLTNDAYKRVYTQDLGQNEYVEIQPEYVYMRIPAEYVCIYHKLLTLFADFGVDMLNDCCAGCKDGNKQLLECWNMFNAAVAARHLGNTKLADTLIKYIEGQLNIKYDGKAPCPGVIWPVDEKGKVKALVSCEDYPRFYVDVETGKLWEEIQSEKCNAVYSIESDHLIKETDGES